MNIRGNRLRYAGIGVAGSVVLVILLLQVATLPVVVRTLTYMPQPLPPELRDPGRWRLDAEQVWIRTADGLQLHGWWSDAASADAERCGVIINLHGNAGNISNRGHVANQFKRRGYAVLLFDYRGFGASEGQPSEAGLYRDAEAALAFVRQRKGVPIGSIVLLAHSLGTAVATELAEGRAVGAVVLVAPFTSLPEAVRMRLKIVPWWLLDWERGRFDALEDMAGIDAPALMAIGSDDELVPRENARALYRAAGSRKEWLDVQGAGHNEVLWDPELFAQADRFIRDALGC